MYKSYKFRLYPNKIQSAYLDTQISLCRYIYNYCLELQIKEYQTNKKRLHKYELQRRITQLKHSEEHVWLKEGISGAFSRETEHLDKAFTSFFKKYCKFPKFKSKKRSKKSFTIPQHFKIKDGKIFIPKLKEGIKVIQHRDLPTNKFTSCTISKTPTNKYFVAIVVQTSDNLPESVPICENQAVGIDLGIKTFATLSNNTTIENPAFLKKSLKKLKRLCKQHSKKGKDSNNREKSRLRLALLYEKITNQRRDFLEKVSKELVVRYDTICLETLGVKDMSQNLNIGRALLDTSFGQFNELIERKAKEHGKNIIRIGRFEPSSKLCTCGVKNTELKLSDRTWTCKSCGEMHDRDLLASNNIKRFAFAKLS